MCLLCDISNKKLDLITARKIDRIDGIRPIYDALREYDVPIDEILNIFNEHNWNEKEIRNVTDDRVITLRKRYKKKQEIREATDDFECY